MKANTKANTFTGYRVSPTQPAADTPTDWHKTHRTAQVNPPSRNWTRTPNRRSRFTR
ncbi:hypothetical protein [Citrobacter freundii]|uniref:hypothetical protein n=1 Tax=Citrobacter freundii TaxID=546 RepID=UPI0028F047ED|nr:hypothetical protein [Citrobacter freundii]WNT10008.1 hypothetical protein RRL16_26185 [Citrobacter freundii]HCL6023504.1 hypothetical protein [Citrobacter freundii]